jgi:TATA-binding protein-associated factor Taf7
VTGGLVLSALSLAGKNSTRDDLERGRRREAEKEAEGGYSLRVFLESDNRISPGEEEEEEEDEVKVEEEVEEGEGEKDEDEGEGEGEEREADITCERSMFALLSRTSLLSFGSGFKRLREGSA